MTVAMPPRQDLDLRKMTPEQLRAASQSVFVRVVDADLKRNSRKENKDVPAWISRALRTEHLDQWRVTLRRMLTQVEGRLRVLDAEMEANEARYSGVTLDDLRAEQAVTRARSERFRQGVLDALAEADALYETRLGELEAAIRAHRDEVVADESIDPSAADQRLWDMLND